MADSVKRVGIEFTAEGAKEFKDSLKEIQKEASANYDEFKKLKKQWNENTKESQKLADQQKYLSNQTETYSKKVELLQQELNAMEADEKTSKQAIEKKKEAIEKTQKKLTEYKDSLKEISDKLQDSNFKLKEWGQQVEKTGKGIENAGKKVSVLSAGVAAIGVAAVASAKDLDKGYDTIITKTGATGEAFDALKSSADKVFSELPTDMDTVGIAIGEVNTRFGSTGKELEDLSKKFIQFAEINGTDLNGAIDKTDTLMMKFGVDSQYTGNILDYMTKVGQDTGISMESLFSSIENNSAILQEMGFGLSGSISLLASFEENGVDAGSALTAFKKTVQNATKEGKSANDVLYETIDKIKGASNQTEALKTATEVFGSKSAPEMVRAIQDGTLNLDDFTQSMYEMGDVVGDTYNATLDPWDELKTATNDLKLAGSELAEEFMNDLVPVIKGVADAIRGAIDWWKGLDDGTKDLIVTIGEIIAILGPVLLIVGKVISVVGVVTTAIGSAGGVIAMLTSPIGIAIASITALVTMGVLLYKNWDTVKEKALQFKDKIVEIFENIKKGVTEKFDSIKEKIKNALDTIKGFLKGEISFPHIKTPHFKISGGQIPWGIGGMGTKPSVSVDWYAKAMQTGLVMRKPTVFGMNENGDLMAGGERGSEVVVGTTSLLGMIQNSMPSNSETNSLLRQLLVEMRSFNSKQIILDSGELVGGISDKMNQSMYDLQLKERRGW